MAGYDSPLKGETVVEAVNKALTATQTISFTNVSASAWVEDSTYADYGYRCDVACEGVTADDFAEVVFDIAESTSGNYAPICETKDGAVSIWSKVADTIIIPTIIITR